MVDREMELACDHCGRTKSIDSHGSLIGEACHHCGIGYWRVRPAAVPSRPTRDGETLSDERRIDELLREFQMACEDAAEFNADSIRASAKHRAILRNELRSELLAVAALRAEVAEARADKERWAAQATANAKDVLRMNWLEAAGGLYDLCCWNVDWPSVNNGWTVGSDEIDDIVKAQTAREALDEAIAVYPEVLAARAASGEDASNQQAGRARSEETE